MIELGFFAAPPLCLDLLPTDPPELEAQIWAELGVETVNHVSQLHTCLTQTSAWIQSERDNQKGADQ